MPSGTCVSTLLASVTLSYPESHSHLSLVNVTAVSFNVPVTEKIVSRALGGLHVECTVNRPGRAALGAIEREIEAATAVVTISNSEARSKVDMKGSV